MQKITKSGGGKIKDLYYWEGPGTSFYRVLCFVSETHCMNYISRHDSFNARWELRDAQAHGEFVLARMR